MTTLAKIHIKSYFLMELKQKIKEHQYLTQEFLIIS